MYDCFVVSNESLLEVPWVKLGVGFSLWPQLPLHYPQFAHWWYTLSFGFRDGEAAEGDQIPNIAVLNGKYPKCHSAAILWCRAGRSCNSGGNIYILDVGMVRFILCVWSVHASVVSQAGVVLPGSDGFATCSVKRNKTENGPVPHLLPVDYTNIWSYFNFRHLPLFAWCQHVISLSQQSLVPIRICLLLKTDAILYLEYF